MKVLSSRYSHKNFMRNNTGPYFIGNNTCMFSCWAPEKQKVTLRIVSPKERDIPMEKDDMGYFHVNVADIPPGAEYYFMLEGEKELLPDPASNFQPHGVHGASAVVNHHTFPWEDAAWKSIPLEDIVLYELHIGTFTEEGTFDAVIPRLDDLISTGINAIEIMPVAQFSGERNWGYDGVFLYAPHVTYGGPEGLKRLVNACHQKGIAVYLDVVYNHVGPEGNVLHRYAPYFTSRYKIPWGDAMNMDDRWADGVRDYISNNPLYWFEYYHIDGLRVDAIHTLYDSSAVSIWELINQKVKSLRETLGRPLYLIAESDLNSPRVTQQPIIGGMGFDAQWLDDFHHALYTLADSRGKRRYEDYGSMHQLAKAYTDGFVLSGEFVKFRKRRFGRSSAGVGGNHFVAFTQNHDQVGNRVKGERLSLLVDFERLKLVAGALFTAPYIPLLFMGEEYAEEAPFLFFCDHQNPELINATREGRKKEFADFRDEGEPADPFDRNTFLQCKLNWLARRQGRHAIMLRWYSELISLRREHPALRSYNKDNIQAEVIEPGMLVIHRKSKDKNKVMVFLNFAEHDTTYRVPAGNVLWKKLIDSRDARWNTENIASAFLPSEITETNFVTVPAICIAIYTGAQ